MIITDLIILAHKQRCTRDGRDCQREQKKKGGGVSCIHLAYAVLDTSPSLPPVSKPLQPVGSAAAASLSHFTATVLQENKDTRCKRLCETNASSSKRFPPMALLMAPAPSQHYFFIQSRKCTVSKQSTSFTVLFCSDQSAVYSILLPCPCTLQTTSVASLKDYVPRIRVDQTY